MAKRRRIALIYQYNENWIGGTYYMENLISALNTLEDQEQPLIYIYGCTEEAFKKLQKITAYKYLVLKPFTKRLNKMRRGINKLINKFFNTQLFSTQYKNIDVLFPTDYKHRFLPGAAYLYWIPDFQEHYLPLFFSENEIDARKLSQQEIVINGKFVVFSSKVAKAHFNEIYPEVPIKQFVLPFAVSHQPSKADESIRIKYNIPNDFFLCSNQFWIHKNHKVIIDAIALLKDDGINMNVVFTGKEHDYRHPDYFGELKQYIVEKGVENNCIFLGFIDRADQLALMQLSRAVIQPSLFEGWSTVVEDAKSLNIFIITSSIDVHKEQLEKYRGKMLFDPVSSIELASCMKASFDKRNKMPYNYSKDISAFGESFSLILNEIISSK